MEGKNIWEVLEDNHFMHVHNYSSDIDLHEILV